MKRNPWLLAFALLLCCAAPASAAGINLGWNDCPPGAGYVLTETFACNTNSGTSHFLVGSFVAPAGLNAMFANEIVIDMATMSDPLPDWWSMQSGGCRYGSLVSSFDFTVSPGTCFDYWKSAASGGINMELLFGNRARIRLVVALPVNDPHIQPIPEGTEVYSFKAIIDDAKTTGLGACGGCTGGACIVLQSIRLYQPVGVGDFLLTNPAASQYVVWQGWSDPRVQCPAVTPVRTPTWGEIKSLYR